MLRVGIGGAERCTGACWERVSETSRRYMLVRALWCASLLLSRRRAAAETLLRDPPWRHSSFQCVSLHQHSPARLTSVSPSHACVFTRAIVCFCLCTMTIVPSYCSITAPFISSLRTICHCSVHFEPSRAGWCWRAGLRGSWLTREPVDPGADFLRRGSI